MWLQERDEEDQSKILLAKMSQTVRETEDDAAKIMGFFCITFVCGYVTELN